ncbi:hypothetical protein H6768_04495 [Candidatus Peribacteria bacterium]|nr:hypothetical protein [Candidatus Peribacteria bacterium]
MTPPMEKPINPSNKKRAGGKHWKKTPNTEKILRTEEKLLPEGDHLLSPAEDLLPSPEHLLNDTDDNTTTS